MRLFKVHRGCNEERGSELDERIKHFLNLKFLDPPQFQTKMDQSTRILLASLFALVLWRLRSYFEWFCSTDQTLFFNLKFHPFFNFQKSFLAQLAESLFFNSRSFAFIRFLLIFQISKLSCMIHVF